MKKCYRLFSIILSISLWCQILSVATISAHEMPSGISKSEHILRSIAKDILACESTLPESFSLDSCFELMEVDPELAEAVFQHIESIAIPIECAIEHSPATARSNSSLESMKDGVYVRDGDGGYFVYEEFDDITPNDFEEETNINNDLIEPFSIKDYDPVSNPKGNRLTSTVCKLFITKDSVPYCASGFFVGNTTIATTAHSIYNSSWEGSIFSSGWADSGYIIQAYDPSSSTAKEPYGRYQIDNKNMAVGASWKTTPTPENDWGVVVLSTGTMRGSYSYLFKKQISANDYIGKYITIYGYPEITGTDPMFYVNGITTNLKSSNFTSNRCIFYTDTSGGDANGFPGMSGSPVIDLSGNVIGIFTGLTLNTEATPSPKRGICISFDSWLYQKLKTYE